LELLAVAPGSVAVATIPVEVTEEATLVDQLAKSLVALTW
jgi:hypothetical protein